MAHVTTNLASPRAQHAFERAQLKFRRQLTEQERAQMEAFSGVDQLIERALTISADIKNEDQFGFCARTSSRIASSLKSFERLLEGVCKLSPMGGDLIWGSISFLLEAAKSEAQTTKEVLDFFLDMAHEIEYLQMVEATFTTSPLVATVVEAVYIAILAFWVKAVQHYCQTRRRKPGILPSMVKLVSSNSMAVEFQQLKSEISSQQTTLDRIAAAQHHADDRSSRRQQYVAYQRELIQWIDAPNYEADFHTADRRRFYGTCEWLAEKAEYLNWTRDPESTFLVIYGIAGAGKTVLSSWLIKQAQARTSDHHGMTLYHYFKDEDDTKNTPLAATRSLLEQVYAILLSSNNVLLANFEQDLRIISQKNHVNFEPLWTVLSSSIHSLALSFSSQTEAPSIPITIVLDAMDECKHSKHLIQRLRRLVHDGLGVIRVVATARKSGDNADELTTRGCSEQSLPTLMKINQHDVQHDIALFVRHKVCNIPRLRQAEHVALRERIISSISNVRNHQGMFLWAHLMCKEMKHPQSTQDTLDLVDNIPSGMVALYERICRRLLQHNIKGLRLGRLVFQWVIASSRPMTFAELKEALKTMKNEGVLSVNELIWSREDAVKSCGDLIRHSGPSEGDTLAPIHLSARQFFSISRSELLHRHPGVPVDIIGPFLVNIPSTEFIMAATCLKSLLSTSLHSGHYLFPVSMDSSRTRNQEDFKKLYPLLDYSVVFWADYVLSRLVAQEELDNKELQQLLASVTEFVLSSASGIWLEELIRLTYIEFAQNTIHQLTLSDHPLIPHALSHWLKLVTKVLTGFSETLSRRPQMVRLCMRQAELTALDDYQIGLQQHGQPLEAIERGWIYYDPATDNMFSFDYISDAPRLRCQIMNTGLRRRPLLATPQKEDGGLFTFHSAAISPNSHYIAVAYVASNDLSICITCWSISDVATVCVTHDWANIIFSSSTDITPSRIQGMKFITDGILFTLGGVFSLDALAPVIGPTIISDPDPLLNVISTHISRGDGNRIARLRRNKKDTTLDLFDMNGALLYTHAFYGRLSAVCFSNTGSKLILSLDQGLQQSKLFCFLVNERERVDMHLPVSLWHKKRLLNPQFTKDEGKFLAITVDEDDHWGLRVWAFDHKYALANMIYAGPNPFVFCMVPGTFGHQDSNALIFDNRSGAIIRQSIDVAGVEKVADKKLKRLDAVIVERDPNLKLVVWLRYHPGGFNDIIFIETWSFENQQVVLHSRFRAFVPTGVLGDTNCALSPKGDHLLVGTRIIAARISPSGSFLGFDIYGLGTQKSIMGTIIPALTPKAAFYKDGTRLAYQYRSKICVFEITQELRIARMATSFLQNDQDGGNALFSLHDPDLLAIGRDILRFEDDRLVVQTTVDNNIYGFSTCGSYCYTVTAGWPNLYALSARTIPAMSRFTPPASIHLNGYSVCPPYMMRLRRSAQVIYLDRKSIDGEEDHYTRPICVLPDELNYHWYPINLTCTLVWPEQDSNNLKLVLVLVGAPRLIDTGIRKDELLREEEWFMGYNQSL